MPQPPKTVIAPGSQVDPGHTRITIVFVEFRTTCISPVQVLSPSPKVKSKKGNLGQVYRALQTGRQAPALLQQSAIKLHFTILPQPAYKLHRFFGSSRALGQMVADQSAVSPIPTYLYSLTRHFFLSESVLVANPELRVSRTERRLSRDEPRLYFP